MSNPGHVDVAIEYGHCVLLPAGGYDDHDELVRSAALGAQLRRRLERQDISSTLQVLVDDKRLPDDAVQAKQLGLKQLLRACETLLNPETFALESALAVLAPDFISQVIEPARSHRVAKDFTRYATTRNGRLACSQDIAVWHALRLGLLDPDALLIAGLCLPRDIPRPARVVVSILPGRFEEYEEHADKEYLRWCHDPSALQRVQRLYFDEHASDREYGNLVEGCLLDVCRTLDAAASSTVPAT